MICVKDLVAWAIENAIGRSVSYPDGWISSDDLIRLAAQIRTADPLPYRLSLTNNMPRREDNG